MGHTLVCDDECYGENKEEKEHVSDGVDSFERMTGGSPLGNDDFWERPD